jgi:hypothetical protein
MALANRGWQLCREVADWQRGEEGVDGVGDGVGERRLAALP